MSGASLKIDYPWQKGQLLDVIIANSAQSTDLIAPSQKEVIDGN